jgi:hypothetical protein
MWLVKQQSSIRRFSQIWLHTRYESREKKKRKKEKPELFYILGYLLEIIIKFWRFGEINSSKSG